MHKNKKKIIFYISDFSLPNMSAYALHVLKMCDAFSEKKYNVHLLVPHIRNKYSFNKVKKDYLLKKRFKINSFFKSKIGRSFFSLILFSFKILAFLKIRRKPFILISRSILPALILSLTGKKIFLEIHTEPKGFTKIFFFFFRMLRLKNKIKFILIHKNLNKFLKLKKEDFIILDDCVDHRDFRKINKKINSCIYTGSFVKGKGVEKIIDVANLLPKINFVLYGNINTLSNHLNEKIKKQKNIILNDFVSYKQITEILPRYKILLMPYEKKINVLIKDLNVSEYISPLKLFDYLASGSVMIASKKKVYSHILKHNYNCFFPKYPNANEWSKIILKVFSKPSSTRIVQENSIKTAKKFSWISRVNKITKFYQD